MGERLRTVAAGLVVAVVIATAAVAAAQDRGIELGEAPFDLTADTVRYERERDLYVARGNVRITHPQRTLTADWVAFSNRTRQGVATGHVVVVEGGDTLYAEVLAFEVDSMEGVVFGGRLDARASAFRMSGDRVRKTGPETYTFEKGSFTTCRCPEQGRDPWTIRAEEADLEVGGYATARNSTFEVLGVPVIWLPWMIYPVKTERETGFLLPEVNASTRSGGDVGLPFFWAVNPQVNLTATPRFLFKRGLMPTGELEYVFGERSGGVLYGAFLHDRDIDPDDPSTPFDENRWAGEWQHVQDLPAEWTFKADAVAFSDNLFPFDIRDFREWRNERYTDSKGFVERRFGRLDRYAASAGVRFADDLSNPDDQDRDEFLIQRLPELQLAGVPEALPGPASRFVTAFDADYTWFTARHRGNRVYNDAPVVGDDLFVDTGFDAIPTGEERDASGARVAFDAHQDDFPGGPEGDGVFQEGEPLADRGHRVLLNPRLALPFRLLDAIEVWPELGWHATGWQTEAQSAELRSLVTGQVDLRTRLRRPLDVLGRRLLHVLEPRLAWTVISNTDQDGNPLFVPATAVEQERVRQLDLLNVTRDPADRIDHVNAVTLALGNRFYVGGEAGGPSLLFGDAAISGQYDFADGGLEGLFLDGTLYPAPSIRSRFDLGWDTDEQRISEGLLQAGWYSEAGHDFGVLYRFLRDVPRFFEGFDFDDERFDEFEDDFDQVSQLSVAGRYAVTRHWGLTYNGTYSFEDSIFLGNRLGIEYISRCLCWAVRVEVDQDRTAGLGVGLRYRLIGLGDDSVRPFQPTGRRSGSRETAEPRSLSGRSGAS
jgi:lipopolysaccharide assembly outer membrane protein LptD (OstA)